jgi:hypothetical protein
LAIVAGPIAHVCHPVTMMRFAKAVFLGAGIWGLLIATPLYFLHDTIARQHPSVTADPQFFYSFLAVTMAWQFAFLVIGSDPGRLRMLMLPGMIEKFGYVLTIVVLWVNGYAAASDALLAVPDCMLGILFGVAFVRTSRSAGTAA